jgi:hypothetical protein
MITINLPKKIILMYFHIYWRLSEVCEFDVALGRAGEQLGARQRLLA